MSNIVFTNNPQLDAGKIYRSQGFLGKIFDRAHKVTGIGLSKDITTSRKTKQKLLLI